MLRSQPPCTPTRQSNQLTAQATVGANSLSMSTTPPDPGTSRASSVWHGESSRAWSALFFQGSLWLLQHAQPGHRPPLPTPWYPQPPSFPHPQLVLSFMEELPTLSYTLKQICSKVAPLFLPPHIPMLVTMVPCLPAVVTRTCF